MHPSNSRMIVFTRHTRGICEVMGKEDGERWARHVNDFLDWWGLGGHVDRT